MSTAPAWLPPLNAHDQEVTSVKIFETDGLRLKFENPKKPPTLWMKIDARVNFFSEDLLTTQMGFPGLSISGYYVPISDCLQSEGNRNRPNCIAEKLYKIVSFALEGDIFCIERYLDEEENVANLVRQSNRDGDDHPVYDKILNFARGMIKKECNISKNTLTVKLVIEKRVMIPDEELASWNSWYSAKKRSNERFANEYRHAISRPRTQEELMREDVARRRSLMNSSMLEVMERVKVVESSSRMCCSICREEFLLESQVIKLPCSHTFDEECLRKWLQESNTCPLCRCTL